MGRIQSLMHLVIGDGMKRIVIDPAGIIAMDDFA